MQAIEQVIHMRKQAIVLVPEISLTPQTRARFQDRFGNVALLHSHMSDSERHFQWRRIVDGDAQVVIGPRSAIFAPLPQLGLIILDEEHESSFKQETIPRITRETWPSIVHTWSVYTAGARSALNSIARTWQRAQTQKYRLVSMPRRIHNPRCHTYRLSTYEMLGTIRTKAL